jgi:hypothetical protein
MVTKIILNLKGAVVEYIGGRPRRHEPKRENFINWGGNLICPTG